jgi:hypothetical protein
MKHTPMLGAGYYYKLSHDLSRQCGKGMTN